MNVCLLGASLWHVAFGVLMCVTAIFLMLIVLVQRGRGGGLAGAFGGAGGQSAFGTKAGDLFTRITIGVATFWICLCVAALWALGPTASRFGDEPVPDDNLSRLKWAEADAIRATLRQTEGHLGKAAEELGISRTTLWRKMNKFSISPVEYKS